MKTRFHEPDRAMDAFSERLSGIVLTHPHIPLDVRIGAMANLLGQLAHDLSVLSDAPTEEIFEVCRLNMLRGAQIRKEVIHAGIQKINNSQGDPDEDGQVDRDSPG